MKISSRTRVSPFYRFPPRMVARRDSSEVKLLVKPPPPRRIRQLVDHLGGVLSEGRNSCRILVSLSLFLILPFIFSSPTLATTVEKLHRGAIFIEGQNGDVLSISWSDPHWNYFKSSIYVQAPDGNLLSLETIGRNEGSGSRKFTFNSGNGVYRLEIDFTTRDYTFSVPSRRVVIEPIKYFSSFVPGISTQRYYFNVPAGTSSFEFYCLSNKSNGTVRLYRPNSTLESTFSLSNSESTGLSGVQKKIINSPASGVWYAEMAASANNGEVGIWLENIPNIFAVEQNHLFLPPWIDVSSKISINTGNFLGPRGKIGGGRLAEQMLSSANPDALKAAWQEIGLEASEVCLNHPWREPSNDNSDPDELNMNGFNWSRQEVEMTVEAGSQPILYGHQPADWIGGTANGSALDDPAHRAEWAEFILAIAVHYNVELGLGIKYISLLDEPNLDGLSANGYAELMKACRAKLDSYPDERVRSVKLYSRSSTLGGEAKNYLEVLIRDADGTFDSLGGHPWMYGYGGYGGLNSTWRFTDDADWFASKLAEHDVDGVTDNRFLITEVNEKWGDNSFQNKAHLDSHLHSLWVASMLIRWIGTGRNEFINIYPFAEDGTVHNYRGLVYADGTFKPAAYAIKFFLDSMQPNVVQVSSDHFEVESLATLSQDGSTLNLMVVNKFPRNNTASFTVTLPASLQNKNCQVAGERLSSPGNSVVKEKSLNLTSTNQLSFQYQLEGESIYSLTITADGNGPSHCLPLGDIDCSGKVNSLDFGYLVSQWGTSDPQANLDDRGVVEALDAFLLLSSFSQISP